MNFFFISGWNAPWNANIFAHLHLTGRLVYSLRPNLFRTMQRTFIEFLKLFASCWRAFFLAFTFHFLNIKITKRKERKRERKKKLFNRFGTSFWHTVSTQFCCQLLKMLLSLSLIFCRVLFLLSAQFLCLSLLLLLYKKMLLLPFCFVLRIFRGSFSLRVIFLYNCVIIWIYSRAYREFIGFFFYFILLLSAFMVVSLMAWFLIECFLWRLITIIIKISYQHKRGKNILFNLRLRLLLTICQKKKKKKQRGSGMNKHRCRNKITVNLSWWSCTVRDFKRILRCESIFGFNGWYFTLIIDLKSILW